MEPLPRRMRERTVALCGQGVPAKRIADGLGTRRPGPCRIRQNLRERGTPEPARARTGYAGGLTTEVGHRLRALVVAGPGATRHASRDRLGLYGSGVAGQRVIDPVPCGHWKACTMLAAVRLGGPLAAVTVDAAVHADAFVRWAREVPAPRLSPGDTVVTDNLPAHKDAAVAEAIEAAGATLRYLPPYSPDSNPIENLWSKVKTRLRAATARTFDALGDAIDSALTAVTPEDCRGFFANDGYLALCSMKVRAALGSVSQLAQDRRRRGA